MPWCVSRTAPHYPYVAEPGHRLSVIPLRSMLPMRNKPLVAEADRDHGPAQAGFVPVLVQPPARAVAATVQLSERTGASVTRRHRPSRIAGIGGQADRRAARAHGSNRAGQRSGRGHGKGLGLPGG